MRKSSNRQQDYRPGTSTRRGSTTTFRQQMAEYAKGELLRELRASKGLSREKAAAEVGVTTKSLYAWENNGGIKRPNAEALAEFYGVDWATLVNRDADAGDQLDRIEAKLDAVLTALGIELVLSRGPADDALRHAESLPASPTSPTPRGRKPAAADPATRRRRPA